MKTWLVRLKQTWRRMMRRYRADVGINFWALVMIVVAVISAALAANFVLFAVHSLVDLLSLRT